MVLNIPEAQGLPGLFQQPPTWPGLANGFTPWPGPNIRSQSFPEGLDDPRWSGHVSIGFPALQQTPVTCCSAPTTPDPGFGTATTEDIAFRALHHTVATDRFLYLSWWVKAADGQTTVQDDQLSVGFDRASGGPMVIIFMPPSTSAVTVAAGQVASPVLKTLDPATGITTGWPTGQPGWISANTRAWVDAPSRRWAVQMRVPLGTGADQVDLGTTFRMWFEVAVELPGDLVATYSWPRNACVSSLCDPPFPPKLKVPPVSVWSEVKLASPTDADRGFVRITPSDIRTTTHPKGSGYIHREAGRENIFEATPTNLTGAVVPAGQLNAEFRLADWGSVCDPAAPWTKIPATFSTTVQPSANPAANAAAIADGQQGSIRTSWTLTQAEADSFEPPVTKKPAHQCMLVTLTGTQILNPASAWQNMRVEKASTFEDRAAIDNRGLGTSPVPGSPRTAYVLVERVSMPPVGLSDGGSPGPGGEGGGEDGGEVIGIARGEDGPGAVGDPAVLAALSAALVQHGDTVDMREQEPTIRYHVYHDTGVDITRESGRTLRMVRPGTVFGFYMEHDGPVRGWNDELRGATRVTDRFYRLEVPEEGTATVTTVIEAVEPGGCLNIFALIRRILKRLFGGP